MSGGQLVRKQVSLREVLEVLSSNTQSPSSFGSDLDRARDGTQSTSRDISSQMLAIEENLLSKAPVYRCVSDLVAYANIRFTPQVDKLRKLAHRAQTSEGACVVTIMRIYQPWATSNPDRGLVAVYEWMRKIDVSLPEIDSGAEGDSAAVFRSGKAPKARDKAAQMVADAEIAIATWVDAWNRSQSSSRRSSGS